MDTHCHTHYVNVDSGFYLDLTARDDSFAAMLVLICGHFLYKLEIAFPSEFTSLRASITCISKNKSQTMSLNAVIDKLKPNNPSVGSNTVRLNGGTTKKFQRLIKHIF